MRRVRFGSGRYLVVGVLATLVVACAKPRPASAPAAPVDAVGQLQSALSAAVGLPGVQRASWGIVVQSLRTSDRLFELNPQTLLVPASTAKLVSVATAVDAVGWDFRFLTTVRAGGTVSDGVLHGDLIVVGSGDPTIGGPAGDDLSVFAAALGEAGIRRIDGRVVGVDDALEEPRPGFGWSWDDLGYSTGAIFGALNIGENRMTVTVTPGAAAGAPTALQVDADTPASTIVNRSVTTPAGSEQRLWPEMRPGESQLTIAGSIPAGASPASVTVSVGNPTARFARALKRALTTAHIDVTGEAVDSDDLDVPVYADASPILFAYRSHPLADVVQPLLKESLNLYGEAVLRLNALGVAERTTDLALEGMGRRLVAWGAPVEGFQLVDGSGLSRRDVLSAEVILLVLTRMYDAANMTPWMTAFPVAGRDGTLAGRMSGTPAEGNVRAKTGTMSNVRSLAGYVTTRDGEPMAFVIIVNNFEGTPTQAMAAIDTIAVQLASFSRQP